MQKTSLAVSLLLAALAGLGGCATITKDANQSVQIETYDKNNQPVTGVKCTAENERGKWTTLSPGFVSVHRSSQNLMVNCEKENEAAGRGTVVSRVNGGMFGNIIFGGGIGAIIDHNKGTAYTYPSWLRIVMGDSLVYDKKDEKENSPVIGKNTATEAPTAETSKENSEIPVAAATTPTAE
ncbi:MAG TPA: hypothetical protein VFF75_07010 [Methylophilaceae bacterium]|nr:hypothetical protein [Methylophilaceae bacterium]HZV62147.1 hypothetical protein [Methylophilaceae bacterium]